MEKNNSAVQQHLEGSSTSAREVALNLKATVGFPYSIYKFFDWDWESRKDYDNFIEFGSISSSIGGRVYDKVREVGYNTTIILYNGWYYVQVETDWEYDSGTVFSNDSFKNYK